MDAFPSSPILYTANLRKYREHDDRLLSELDEYFWRVFDYLRANQIEGSYVEFGSGHNVISFRLAAKYHSLMYPLASLVAFDSFEGLPEPRNTDANAPWPKGAMKVTETDFHHIVQAHGLKSTDYTAVRGFYDQTLRLPPAAYGIHCIAFAFVDCDLYESTSPVLPFISSSLIDGAVVAFDDWNCFKASSRHGQRKALSEFVSQHPGIEFIPFLPIGWHGASFVVRVVSNRDA